MPSHCLTSNHVLGRTILPNNQLIKTDICRFFFSISFITHLKNYMLNQKVSAFRSIQLSSHDITQVVDSLDVP